MMKSIFGNPLLRNLFLLFSFSFCVTNYIVGQDTLLIFGSGNYSDMTVTTSHSNGTSNGTSTVDGLGLLPNLEATSRFLGQATLGANYDSIVATSEKSYNQWLDEQFNMTPAFTIQDMTMFITSMAVDSTLAMGGDPTNLDPQRWFWHTAWWQYTMLSPDLLRNKVALALSEIFVISEVPQLQEVPLALANYYDVLLDNSFGNFRDLLEDVSLHPAMGLYLTHMNNPKADSTFFRFPDENYAREVMQLFSIGLYELNPDGTPILDNNGNFIPTYDNADIQEFSKIFTGLTYGDAYAFGLGPLSEVSFTQPMKMYNSWHEPGPKNLLNGMVIPDRNPVDGMADISDALDNLFNHPNVGPFIGYRLIQRLVKSNPSPEYVARVTAAFNDDGQGVRGNMKALIKAILLDPEARNCSYIDDPTSGKLREPIARYTHVMRGFNAYVEEGLYRNYMGEFYNATDQRPLASPSVFNFFQTNYQPIGGIEQAGLVAPEFQITNTVTIAGFANELHEWIFDEFPMQYWGMFNDELWNGHGKRVYLDLSEEIALGDDEHLNELIERINIVFLHGQMNDTTRSIIYDAAIQLPAESENDIETRVKLVIYLALISPDYMIQK